MLHPMLRSIFDIGGSFEAFMLHQIAAAKR
jgi:hypothetical protein